MLRRFVFKSSLPAVSSCRRKSIAGAATDFPVQNGRKDVTNGHANGANDSNSSTGEGHRKAPRWKQRRDIPSSKLSMFFQKSNDNPEKAQKRSSLNSVGDDEDIAKLGPSPKLSMFFMKSGDNLEKAQKRSSPPNSVGDYDNIAKLGPSPKLSMSFLKSGDNLEKPQKRSSSPNSVGDNDNIAKLGPSPKLNLEKAQKRSSSPNTVGDDDDFAELGPSVSEDTDSSLKLVTEVKRMIFTNKSCSSTVSSRKDNSLRVRRKDCDQGKNNGPKVEVEEKQYSATKENHVNSSSVYICNVPQSIRLNDLEKAVAVFGRIKSASVTKERSDFTDYLVTFESVESKDRAAAAKSITVNNCKLSIHTIGTEFLKIKLTNVSWSTAESMVHSICVSLGRVSGLTRTREGAIEVVFQTNGSLTEERIVKYLTNVVLDDCQWSAQLLSPLDANTNTMIPGSHVLPESRISNLIQNYRKQLQMQQIYLDDLDSLHHAILHLRDVPADVSS